MYKYPYGDSQQLNLDWIISKIKELEEGGAGGGADLEAVANALVTLSFNLNTQYRRYDYCFLNGKLYRCLSDTSGVFDPSAWQEALIGDDLAVLTRWINAIDAAAVVDVKFDTSGTNGKLQQKYHDEYHDVVEVDYTPVQNSKRPLSSNAGYELNGAITSEATTRANADTTIESGLAIIVTGDTCSTAVPSGGYAYIKNNTHGLTEGLYRNKTSNAFPTSGGTANSTVFEAVSNGGLNAIKQSGSMMKYMTTAYAGTATSVPSDTNTEILQYPLPAGKHLIEITFTFQKTDPNGERKAMYQINSGTIMTLAEAAPAPDGYTTLCAISTYVNSTDATLKAIAYQSSGSAMNVRAWLNELCFE